ncbi:flavohemoprotein, partial [Pseudanabaenaceae cyanobacterium LEGE 13415]|nr:flavohemoprotein [Pseudanabaenaceae cyanobacterium LEGE 13415]
TPMNEQGKKLFASLVLVINSLRQPDALNGALTGLGTRHVQYGVLPEHYPMVGNTLLKTLESFLGTDWTPQTKQTWIDAYDAIAEIMLEGADYPPAVLKLSARN